ncbi:homing endonuclease [Jimgerdemannia flammicorona]|uniref:Homing endonuclease n=1 Tax=Jimgerdemannia flammicorona TaxID=994334 RepID=A0A433DML3_9FUNG|nr:homing endonuclease [Jimgerdemannia flammicorona]
MIIYKGRGRNNVGPAEGLFEVPRKDTGNEPMQTNGNATLTNAQFEAGVGILLGDGGMISGKNGSALLFGQSTIHTLYLLFVFGLFFDYCLTFPNLTCIWDHRYNHYNYLWQFRTMALPCFNPLRIHPSIGCFLTEISLAHWIMCDGGKILRGGVFLDTFSFTIDEQLLNELTAKCIGEFLSLTN